MNSLGHTKRTKIVATRHVLWAPNVPKMLYGRGSAPDTAGSSVLPQTTSWIWEGGTWRPVGREVRGGNGRKE